MGKRNQPADPSWDPRNGESAGEVIGNSHALLLQLNRTIGLKGKQFNVMKPLTVHTDAGKNYSPVYGRDQNGRSAPIQIGPRQRVQTSGIIKNVPIWEHGQAVNDIWVGITDQYGNHMGYVQADGLDTSGLPKLEQQKRKRPKKKPGRRKKEQQEQAPPKPNPDLLENDEEIKKAHAQEIATIKEKAEIQKQQELFESQKQIVKLQQDLEKMRQSVKELTKLHEKLTKERDVALAKLKQSGSNQPAPGPTSGTGEEGETNPSKPEITQPSAEDIDKAMQAIFEKLDDSKNSEPVVLSKDDAIDAMNTWLKKRKKPEVVVPPSSFEHPHKNPVLRYEWKDELATKTDDTDTDKNLWDLAKSLTEDGAQDVIHKGKKYTVHRYKGHLFYQSNPGSNRLEYLGTPKEKYESGNLDNQGYYLVGNEVIALQEGEPVNGQDKGIFAFGDYRILYNFPSEDAQSFAQLSQDPVDKLYWKDPEHGWKFVDQDDSWEMEDSDTGASLSDILNGGGTPAKKPGAPAKPKEEETTPEVPEYLSKLREEDKKSLIENLSALAIDPENPTKDITIGGLKFEKLREPKDGKLVLVAKDSDDNERVILEISPLGYQVSSFQKDKTKPPSIKKFTGANKVADLNAELTKINKILNPGSGTDTTSTGPEAIKKRDKLLADIGIIPGTKEESTDPASGAKLTLTELNDTDAKLALEGRPDVTVVVTPDAGYTVKFDKKDGSKGEETYTDYGEFDTAIATLKENKKDPNPATLTAPIPPPVPMDPEKVRAEKLATNLKEIGFDIDKLKAKESIGAHDYTVDKKPGVVRFTADKADGSGTITLEVTADGMIATDSGTGNEYKITPGNLVSTLNSLVGKEAITATPTNTVPVKLREIMKNAPADQLKFLRALSQEDLEKIAALGDGAPTDVTYEGATVRVLNQKIDGTPQYLYKAGDRYLPLGHSTEVKIDDEDFQGYVFNSEFPKGKKLEGGHAISGPGVKATIFKLDSTPYLYDYLNAGGDPFKVKVIRLEDNADGTYVNNVDSLDPFRYKEKPDGSWERLPASDSSTSHTIGPGRVHGSADTDPRLKEVLPAHHFLITSEFLTPEQYKEVQFALGNIKPNETGDGVIVMADRTPSARYDTEIIKNEDNNYLVMGVSYKKDVVQALKDARLATDAMRGLVAYTGKNSTPFYEPFLGNAIHFLSKLNGKINITDKVTSVIEDKNAHGSEKIYKVLNKRWAVMQEQLKLEQKLIKDRSIAGDWEDLLQRPTADGKSIFEALSGTTEDQVIMLQDKDELLVKGNEIYLRAPADKHAFVLQADKPDSTDTAYQGYYSPTPELFIPLHNGTKVTDMADYIVFAGSEPDQYILFNSAKDRADELISDTATGTWSVDDIKLKQSGADWVSADAPDTAPDTVEVDPKTEKIYESITDPKQKDFIDNFEFKSKKGKEALDALITGTATGISSPSGQKMEKTITGLRVDIYYSRGEGRYLQLGQEEPKPDNFLNQGWVDNGNLDLNLALTGGKEIKDASGNKVKEFIFEVDSRVFLYSYATTPTVEELKSDPTKGWVGRSGAEYKEDPTDGWQKKAGPAIPSMIDPTPEQLNLDARYTALANKGIVIPEAKRGLIDAIVLDGEFDGDNYILYPGKTSDPKFNVMIKVDRSGGDAKFSIAGVEQDDAVQAIFNAKYAAAACKAWHGTAVEPAKAKAPFYSGKFARKKAFRGNPKTISGFDEDLKEYYTSKSVSKMDETANAVWKEIHTPSSVVVPTPTLPEVVPAELTEKIEAFHSKYPDGPTLEVGTDVPDSITALLNVLEDTSVRKRFEGKTIVLDGSEIVPAEKIVKKAGDKIIVNCNETDADMLRVALVAVNYAAPSLPETLADKANALYNSLDAKHKTLVDAFTVDSKSGVDALEHVMSSTTRNVVIKDEGGTTHKISRVDMTSGMDLFYSTGNGQYLKLGEPVPDSTTPDYQGRPDTGHGAHREIELKNGNEVLVSGSKVDEYVFSAHFSGGPHTYLYDYSNPAKPKLTTLKGNDSYGDWEDESTGNIYVQSPGTSKWEKKAKIVLPPLSPLPDTPIAKESFKNNELKELQGKYPDIEGFYLSDASTYPPDLSNLTACLDDSEIKELVKGKGITLDPDHSGAPTFNGHHITLNYTQDSADLISGIKELFPTAPTAPVVLSADVSDFIDTKPWNELSTTEKEALVSTGRSVIEGMQNRGTYIDDRGNARAFSNKIKSILEGDTSGMTEATETDLSIIRIDADVIALRGDLESAGTSDKAEIQKVIENSKVLLTKIEDMRGSDSNAMSGALGDTWWSVIKLKTDATKKSRE